jgi:hypothetical protein
MKMFKNISCYTFLLFLLFFSCKSSGPVNKAILSDDKPSKNIIVGYKDAAKKLERSEKKRLRKEARLRSKRMKSFENNKIR